MRKFLYYSLLCLLWISVVSCKDEEASAPPQSSFTVDKTSGLSGDTKFTFTVNQVSAQNISLLPYGLENASSGGILIPASSFVNGVAVIKDFQYNRVGVFNAVVVTNNHSDDGTSVANTPSAPTAITITSNQSKISEFDLGTMRSADFNEKLFTSLSTKTTIDEGAKTITVNVRYALAKNTLNASYFTDLTKLVPTFKSSDSSKVYVNGVLQKPRNIVGGIAQVATIPTIDFSSPVDFVVKAADGTTSATYKVTVTKTPIETKTTIKSLSGVAGKKAAKERAMTGYVDNANKRVVIYDVYGTDPIQFDSMKVKYELDGEFSILKQDGKTFDATKAIFDLTPNKPFVVYSQDSLSAGGTATYNVYAVTAPKLSLKITSLIPQVTGTTEDFTVKFSVLNGTALGSLTTSGAINLPTGANVISATIGGATAILTPDVGDATILNLAATGVDLTGTPKAELTVDMGTYTYKVVYAISVTPLK